MIQSTEQRSLSPLSYLNDGSIKMPFFEKVTLADHEKDGYWMHAVDIKGNGRLDLIVTGLAIGKVDWYENKGGTTWERHQIGQFSKPVAMDFADIAGNGRNDLVVCHDYGNCMFWCRPEDGKISWLENPGDFTDPNKPWKVHHIGDLMAAHRLELGHFTQTKRLELMAIPVVGHEPYGEGVHHPVKVMLYQRPDDVLNATQWEGKVINNDYFRAVHEVVGDHFGGYSGENLESFLLASEEGINWFYYEQASDSWKIVPIGKGDDRYFAETGLKGCGSVAYGRVGDDPYAYIATMDPLHGGVVTVYTRQPGKALTDHAWKRTVLDEFGPFTAAAQGAGHHVITGDFDGDGNDEFLVALRGPLPHQGVYYYKAIDLEQGLFERWRISTASTARIALGDFDGDGRLDFATTGYYTPGYYLCDNSQVNVFYNRFAEAVK